MGERLTDLRSENRPRSGGGIGHGDVVQFDRAVRDTGRTEGVVQCNADGKDQYGRPVLRVLDAEGGWHFPLLSHAVRVDPPVIPDDAPVRSFDERKGF